MNALAVIQGPRVDWPTIAPVVAMFATGLAIVLLCAVGRRAPRTVHTGAVVITFVGIATASALLVRQWHLVKDVNHLGFNGFQTFGGQVAVDGLGVFVQAVVLGACALGALLALGYLRREDLETPEFLALLVLCATGMMVMAQANDLVVVFVALEVFSIALYVLAAFDRRRLESQEAGLKYFVLGAFSSAILLYGIALTYGATGTTSLTGIHAYLGGLDTSAHTGLLFAGFALLLVGLGFKIAATPFHMWVPDVYQGAPAPVTAFMAAATKIAAFAALLRIFDGSFVSYRADWQPAIYALAVVSLVVGTVAAAAQVDVKRMLAYSSIAHAGYALIGVEVGTSAGTAAALFYLLVYAVMAIGAFGVVQVISRRHEAHHELSDYQGLAAKEPRLAALLTLFLLAQAGVPLTGGFIAKVVIFESAVLAGQWVLALIGMLAAVIGAFVYLRVVVAMYTSSADASAAEVAEVKRIRVDFGSKLALGIAGVGVIVLGITPGWFVDFAHQATQLLARR